VVAIKWSKGQVTGHFAGKGERGVLLAHGAGTNQDHPAMVATRDGLAAEGVTVLTFNYPYTEAGKARPDSTEVLLECHRAALAVLQKRVDGVVLAGRSMGGRMGTYLAADGDPVLGVVCYAYPLHPPGKPEKLRIEHLPDIKVPTLFFQGSRDALSRSDLFDRYVRSLPTAEVVDMEVDHSLGGVKNVPFLVAKTAKWIRTQGW
jgi:predicted alpha/beta-hydrolase family hydrolase